MENFVAHNGVIIEHFLGFSSEELLFLQAARNGSSPEHVALHQAISSLATTTTDTGKSFIFQDGPQDDPAGAIDIPYLRLMLSAAPLVLLAAISAYLRLGLHQKLAVAVIRCFAQLNVLGFILVPIFVTNKWWLTLLYTIFMLLVTGVEAISRPAQSYDGMLFEVLFVIGVAASVTITFALAIVIQIEPWYDAQYLIPMLGMLLGNSCSSVAVGLSAALDELSSGKDKVEALLVLGATRIEATREVVVRAARLALTPLLNTMNVVGIVSIPGMMVGQVLGGSNPGVAARYQILILFLVTFTSGSAAIATVYAAVLTICDNKHRLRAEKLQTRVSRTAGAMGWVVEQVRKGWRGVKDAVTSAGRKMKRVFQGQPAPRSRHRYSRYLQGGSEFTAVEEGRGNGVEVEQPLLGGSAT